MRMNLLARMGEFDVEFTFEIDDVTQAAGIINNCIQEGIQPRPRFQQQSKVQLPFVGTIESTELMPAKDGKREYCLAHVKADSGDIVDVRYFPPLKTWKAGERATVQKGQYGPELKEIDEGGTPPPF